MPRPFRFWMTGGIAVVTAALGGKAMADSHRQPQARSSRWTMAETVQRLEQRAHEHGLAVFARMAQRIGRQQAEPAFEDTVIVFESVAGGTPVFMQDADSRPDLPLSIVVRNTEDGRVEVILRLHDLEGVPEQVARDMTEMPFIVDEALV